MNFKDYRGYKVYDNGVVIGKRGKPLNPSLSQDGYPQIGIWDVSLKKVVTYPIHRLMGILFLPNFKGLPTIDHKDRNRTNNSLYNLHWESFKGQCNNRNLWINRSCVGYDKRRKRWRATIYLKRRVRTTRNFKTKEEALKQRVIWEMRYPPSIISTSII